MAYQRPLIIKNGRIQQLPAADSAYRAPGVGYDGVNARYAIPGAAFDSVTTASPSANNIRYFPIYIENACTFDQLTFEVTAAAVAGSSARLGIYKADSDLQPTSLVVDAGTVAIDTTGVKTVSISTTLDPGFYLQCMHQSGAPTLRVFRGSAEYSGFLQAMGTSPFYNAFQKSQTYNAATPLPSTGTTWDTQGGSSATGFNYYILMRLTGFV